MIFTKRQALKWGVQGSWIFSVTWSRGTLRTKTARLPLQGDCTASWMLNPGELLLATAGKHIWAVSRFIFASPVYKQGAFVLHTVYPCHWYSKHPIIASEPQLGVSHKAVLRPYIAFGDNLTEKVREWRKRQTHTQHPGSSPRLLYRAEPRDRNTVYSGRKQITLISLGSLSIREKASGHKSGVGEKTLMDIFCAHC